MRRSQWTEERSFGIRRREAGQPIAEVCRDLGVRRHIYRLAQASHTSHAITLRRTC
jgi:hypothetical protein